MKLIIHTDGGARGNPGPAAVGVVIEVADQTNQRVELTAFGKKIGETTNNVAEYTGVIEALRAIKDLSHSTHTEIKGAPIEFYLDSTLVVNQLNGVYRIKLPHLRELLIRVRGLESDVGGNISYASVPREQNSRADYFVNHALDH